MHLHITMFISFQNVHTSYIVDWRVVSLSMIISCCSLDWPCEASSCNLVGWEHWGVTVVGLCLEQNLDFRSGVLGQPVRILPGRPLYSALPASLAKYTSQWFFMFPSMTNTSPHPRLSHLCSWRLGRKLCIHQHYNYYVVMLEINTRQTCLDNWYAHRYSHTCPRRHHDKLQQFRGKVVCNAECSGTSLMLMCCGYHIATCSTANWKWAASSHLLSSFRRSTRAFISLRNSM